jgi:hypothetical protein
LVSCACEAGDADGEAAALLGDEVTLLTAVEAVALDDELPQPASTTTTHARPPIAATTNTRLRR